MSTPRKRGSLTPCFVLLDPLTPRTPNSNFSEELKHVLNERNILTTKTRRRVTEALDALHQESEEQSRAKRRQRILDEILESEENYLKQLNVIQKFFVKPTQNRQLLDEDDFESLFGSLDSIYRINRELLDELYQNPADVAAAFSRIAPFFKSYSFYAFEFKKALDILQNCHKDNPKFAKFLEAQESRPEVQSKLSALLIAPIQRVPRYKLLLQPLLELTDKGDPEYSSLADSLSKVENAAEHINKIIRERENMQRLLEIQRCLINNEPKIITPGRYLIKEGLIFKLSIKHSHSHKLHLVLTNDIVMFCKMKKDELKVNSLKCTGIYPLNKCRVLELTDKGAFRLICQNEEIVLYHKNLRTTLEWLDAIRGAIHQNLEDRRSLRKESSSRRPVKRKDLLEYNELGVSPGKRLKKRKNYQEEEGTTSNFLLPSKRRPLATNGNNRQSESVTSEQQSNSSREPSEVSERTNGGPSGDSQEVFVFGRNNHTDHGFSFKMNQLLCGIGSSVKKMFGFNNNTH